KGRGRGCAGGKRDRDHCRLRPRPEEMATTRNPSCHSGARCAHARPGAAASGGGCDARACQDEAPLVCRLDDGTRHRRLTAPRSADGRYQAQARQLAILLALVHSWGTGYDWRKAEAKLNALPQFVEDIEGVDIHFIHVRSRHKNALPVIITHGWPGSVIEQLKIIGPLTDPTAHGGSAADAFDVVIP